jgi:hypothetical protein
MSMILNRLRMKQDRRVTLCPFSCITRIPSNRFPIVFPPQKYSKAKKYPQLRKKMAMMAIPHSVELISIILNRPSFPDVAKNRSTTIRMFTIVNNSWSIIRAAARLPKPAGWNCRETYSGVLISTCSSCNTIPSLWMNLPLMVSIFF